MAYQKDYINSNVGLVSIVKEALTEENARIMALNLCATLGNNPLSRRFLRHG